MNKCILDNMRNLFFFVILLLCGCTSAPVSNINGETIPTAWNGSAPALGDVEKAILSASQTRGWNSRIVRPGLIEASISVRSHRAEISIPYTERNYSIYYKSSDNLDYRNGSIHRNYNKWVMKLSQAIQRELGINVQKY